MTRRFAVLCTALWLVTAACSGLSGEPRIVATLIPPTPLPATATPAESVAQLSTVTSSTESSASDATLDNAAVDQGYPASPPDLANGAQLYAQHCTRCHGPNGEGDGELVLSGEVSDPGNFRDPALAAAQLPIDWFDTITEGRIENLMPPWRNALTEQERWDVAMYTYTMHYTAEQIEIGQHLFADCAGCHGETGRGDGPDKEPGVEVADLTNPQDRVVLSDSGMFRIVQLGNSEVMPAYGEVFTFEEIASVVAYARTLSLANAAQVIGQSVESAAQTQPEVTTTQTPVSSTPTPIVGVIPNPTGSATETPVTESATLPITGNIENQTPGGEVPAGITVTLKVFDAISFEPLPAFERQTTLNADNTFRFDDILVEIDKAYLTSVQYAGRDFASGLFQGDPTLEEFSLPITLYELTDDSQYITITAAVSQIRVTGQTIEITQVMQFNNSSDRVFTSLTPDADGRYPWKVIDLPPASVVINTDTPSRYVIPEDNSAVYDTRPLLPGESRFAQITYITSYNGGAIIEYPVPYRVDGQVRLLVQPLTITANSTLLPSVGEEIVGEEAYNGYGQPLTLNPGELIRYELTGQIPGTETPLTENVISSDALIGFIAIALGVTIAVVTLLIVILRRPNTIAQTSISTHTPAGNHHIDALVRQIAELDAQHEAGQINHDLWHQQRAVLKTQLARLMGDNKPT